MRRIKFEIVLEDEGLINYLLDVIKAMLRSGDIIKIEISTFEEEEE